MNLHQLLLRVEANASKNEATKEYEIVIGEDTYKVRTLTREEKRSMIYSRRIKQEMTVGDIVKWAIPYIYKSLQLADVAQAARAKELIVKYHDIVELLFEPQQILEILEFISDINNLASEPKEVLPI